MPNAPIAPPVTFADVEKIDLARAEISVAPEPIPAFNGETPPAATAEALAEKAAALIAKYKGELGLILNPEIKYQDRMVEFISMDFSRLKGSDLKAIGREFKARFKPDPKEIYCFNNDYLILAFSRINDLDEGFFDKVNGNIYMRLTDWYKAQLKEVLGLGE